MKKLLIVVLICAASVGFSACKNYNPSGTPPKNDTTFINRHADSSAGGSGSATPTATDTAGQKKDSTKH